MNLFIQTITDLFLDREEFLKTFSPMNKHIRFIEFFCILLGSISLAISAVLVNSPPSSGYLAILVFLTMGNYFFLSLVASFISYFIDYKAKNLIKSGDLPSLQTSSRCLNIIYIFACPIAIVFSFIGVPSFSAYFGIVIITLGAYVWIFAGFANDIYAIGAFRAFRTVISSILFVLYIPFAILFYFLLNLSIVI